jgi:hypothetical protein
MHLDPQRSKPNTLYALRRVKPATLKPPQYPPPIHNTLTIRESSLECKDEDRMPLAIQAVEKRM